MPPTKTNNNLHIQVNNFDGNSDYLPHFFSLVKELAEVSSWSDNQTLLFLKSKLTGPALKYFLECPQLQASQSIVQIETAFKTFFTPTTSAASLNELNSIALLPEENFVHFAHRIRVLSSKVYKDVNDDNALNCILFNKFISTVPANIRMKLLEENCTSFDAAVSRAHQLQQILNNELIPQSANNSNNNSAIATQLATLTERLNAITSSESNINRNMRINQSGPFRQNKFRHNYSNKRQFVNSRASNIICQICNRSGHSARTCFRFTRRNFNHTNNSNRPNSNNQNFNAPRRAQQQQDLNL